MSKRFLSFIGLIAFVAVAATIVSACASSAAPAPTAAPAPAAAAPAAAPTAAAAANSAAPATQFPKMTLKLGNAGVTDMSYNQGSLKFAELVKQRTGGAVDIQVFPNSQLGSEKDMIEQVKSGVINFSITSPTFLASFDGFGPLGVLGMPYIIPGNTDEDQYPVLIKLARGPLFKDVLDKAAAQSNLRVLDMGWWYGTRNLTNNKRPVVHPADMKGLKIRVMDTPLAKVAMAALGAQVTPMAVAELYTAMQTGAVDGQENPNNTIYTSKYYEVQKYLSTTGHMTMNILLDTNEKWFQSLSPDLQKVLVQAAYDAGDYQSQLQLKMNAQNLQDLKSKGMTVTEVNKAEFADATKDAWKQFESLFGQGFYEKVKAAAGN
ncbi:MAG: TRAP transporter substrate-binding protein [Actinobacteria bacterium]|nr:TRAP transporter substrate-binding protein [Actinomycetota bacterium]